MLLAKKLEPFKKKYAVVFGIPRGGIVVAKAVADYLKLPLDIIVVKKIGAPGNPELAIGAAGPKGVVYWDENLCQRFGISERIKSQELGIKNKEREEREKRLRGEKPYDIKDKNIILVDDGVATGATVLAAGKFFKEEKAKKAILAIPVIPRDTLFNIKEYFDRIIVLSIEENFYAVGQFYCEFPQVEDEEVIQLLK